MEIAPSVYFYPFTSMSENNCNTIIIDGPEKILIDPGHKHLWPRLQKEIEKDGFRLSDFKLVIHTHCHPDHMEAGSILEEEYGAIQAMHKVEAEFLEGEGQGFFPWMGLDLPGGTIGRHLEEGPLTLADKTIYLYHTPGHSPGGLCLHWPEARLLVSGDLIFARGVGRSDFPGSDPLLLSQSVKRMEALQPVDIILPGHGPAILGAENVISNYEAIKVWL